MTAAIEHPVVEKRSRKRKRGGDPFIGPRLKRGRRPKPPGTKKKRSPKQPKGRTIIKGQIKNSPSLDVWTRVWEFSSPATLLTMQRVCKTFKDELTRHPAIWKAARLYAFDNGLPDPPKGTSEAHYAWLLSGYGCQACDNRVARRVYWCWASRWCESCFKRLTVRASCFTDGLPHQRILESIPYAIFNGLQRYLHVGPNDEMSRWGRSEDLVYLRRDLNEIIEEYDTFQKTEPTLDDTLQWFDDHETKAKESMAHLSSIETALLLHERIEMDTKRATRLARRQGIHEKAQEMNPPIWPATLDKMKCYKLANRIDRQLNERCWNALRPKILEEYGTINRADQERSNQEALARRRQLVDARIGVRGSNLTQTPAIVIVMRLCKLAIQEEVSEMPMWRTDRGKEGRNADDFALRVLRTVRYRYYELPETDRPKDGEGNPYVLTMLDAKALVDEDISDATQSWNVGQKKAAIFSFKCPKCKVGNFARKTFVVKITHVVEHHAFDDPQFAPLKPLWEPEQAGGRGDELNFSRVAWPKNMPLLNRSQTRISEPWDPDDELQYHRAAPTTGDGEAPISRSIDELYKDRAASEGGPEGGDVVAQIVYAALKLRDTGLSPSAQTLMALDYGAMKCPSDTADQAVVEQTAIPPTEEITVTSHIEQAGGQTASSSTSSPQLIPESIGEPMDLSEEDSDSEADAELEEEAQLNAANEYSAENLDTLTTVVEGPGTGTSLHTTASHEMTMQMHQQMHPLPGPQVGQHALTTLPTELVRHGLFEILSRAKCGLCSSKLYIPNGSRHRDQWRTIGELLSHYFLWHGTTHKHQWGQLLWLKPSYEAVLKELEDYAEGRRVFDELFPRVGGRIVEGGAVVRGVEDGDEDEATSA